MKAVTLQKEGIKVVDTSVPTPNDFQVLVKVYACGLNRSDLLETQGQSFGHMGSNLKILGGEFAGEVIELGSKVSNLSKGDKVMCRGGSGWAEFALAHHLRCVKFQNEQINWEKASSIQGSLQTMHDAIITNGKFKKGQSIFIQGASSGVGLIGLQIGKCLGASLIFGSSSDQTRLKKLSEFGADHLIDISKSNWKNIILDKTDGKGVDLVIESTGISEPLPEAETFTFEDESGVSLSDVSELDTMVTVVDAVNFLKDYDIGHFAWLVLICVSALFFWKGYHEFWKNK